MKILGLSQQFIVTVGVMLLASVAVTVLASIMLLSLDLGLLILAEGALAVTCLYVSDTRFVIK